MINWTTLKTDFEERMRKELPDSLDQVILTLFTVSVLLSLIKLFIVIPIYVTSVIAISVTTVAIVFRLAIFYILYRSPRHLILLIKIGLVWMAAYILIFILFSEDGISLMSIQHMFIVIMLAFYGINRFWGIAFSALFFVTVMLFMFGMQTGQLDVTMFPESFPFYTAFILVLLNFCQIAFIHFLYHRTLTNTVRDMRVLNKQLAELVSAKSNFLSTMSHELRTPLNAVIGTAYLLVESDTDETQRKNIQNLRFSAESLLVLINDILDFSKMDSKYIQLESIPFSPGEIVEHVFEGMQQKADEKSVKIQLNMESNIRTVKVLGDPGRLTQIVFNILGNAIKFTSVGEVTVTVDILRSDESEHKLLLSIADTGIGIDPAMHGMIFEPFTQASSSTNRQFGGTGLGLAIVNHLVSLHEGEIGMTSQLGQGTTFRLKLPYNAYFGETASDGEENRNQKVIQDRSFTGMRLLLAEDNQMSVLFMRQLLARWDLEPEVVFDGDGVIELVSGGHHFDVILMDIHMPNVNGLAAAEYIRDWERKNEGYAHIIALTASVSDEIVQKLTDLGFDDYLGKPFNPNDLRHKLEVAEAKASIRKTQRLDLKR